MKHQLLLPRTCRIVGLILLPFAAWILFGNITLPFLNTGLKVGFEDNYNLTLDFAIAAAVISLIMIAFSKLKREDEYLMAIRLRSLQIAVYINYAAFLVGTFAVNGTDYLGILMYNTVTVLVVFILVFNYNLYIKPRFTKQSSV